MAAVTCKVEIPEVQGLRENELTVGRDFLLHCEGEFPKELAQDKLHFVLTPEQKYVIKLRGFEYRSATSADMKVTSYVAGPQAFQNLQLTDGTTTLDLGEINFMLQSVLPPPEQPKQGEAPKKNEPYGPIGPATIGIPQSYWMALAAVVGVLILFIAMKSYRFFQRRRLLEGLRKHDSAQSPIHEFYAHQRKLQRYNTVFFGGEGTPEDISAAVVELQRMLKLYITRKYKVPAMEWSPRLVAQDLKRYHHKAYLEFGTETQKLLAEFNKAQKDANKVKTSDVLNLNKRTRVLVESLEKIP
jgi:hypothetical protein